MVIINKLALSRHDIEVVDRCTAIAIIGHVRKFDSRYPSSV